MRKKYIIITGHKQPKRQQRKAAKTKKKKKKKKRKKNKCPCCLFIPQENSWLRWRERETARYWSAKERKYWRWEGVCALCALCVCVCVVAMGGVYTSNYECSDVSSASTFGKM